MQDSAQVARLVRRFISTQYIYYHSPLTYLYASVNRFCDQDRNSVEARNRAGMIPEDGYQVIRWHDK